MRPLLAALALIATPALAEDTMTSALIARDGLTATAQALAQDPASPDRDLALSATRFLSGIEAIYQARWRIGATDGLLPVPVLGTALPPNPAPQAMQADALNVMAADLIAAMQNTRDSLPDTGGALILNLDDLWFDIDGDGQRGRGEDLPTLTGLPRPENASPRIRFDAADAHWLRAYTHLIAAMAELTLAFDPEPALADRIALDAELAKQFAQPPGQMARAPNFDLQARAFGPMVDRVAVTLQTLRHQPDKAHVTRAADHLRAMIAANRDFWQAVAAETDNDREWIPNDDQQAALGFDLPPDTGALWLSLLDEAEQVLDGRMLIPFWRFAPGYGVDLAMWLDDPQPVDLIGWVQGTAALPYARPGLTVGRDNLDRFRAVFSGRAGLYMVLFN